MNIKKCLENTTATYRMMNLNNYIIILLLFALTIGENSISSKVSKSESDKLYRRAKSLENSGFKDEAEQVYKQIFLELIL